MRVEETKNSVPKWRFSYLAVRLVWGPRSLYLDNNLVLWSRLDGPPDCREISYRHQEHAEAQSTQWVVHWDHLLGNPDLWRKRQTLFWPFGLQATCYKWLASCWWLYHRRFPLWTRKVALCPNGFWVTGTPTCKVGKCRVCSCPISDTKCTCTRVLWKWRAHGFHWTTTDNVFSLEAPTWNR